MMKMQASGAVVPVLSMPMARRIVVRDMGNGVDRVEAHELIVGPDAYEHFKLPGLVPVLDPMPQRVMDLVMDLVADFGADPGLVCSCVRRIDDRTVEIFAAWS